MRLTHASLCCVLTAFAFGQWACSSYEGPEDGGTTAQDGGTNPPIDSGVNGDPDAGEDPDAGDDPDAGPPEDAGTQDTDGDGTDDLIEIAIGTDPNDPADNPEANGDLVVVAPYGAQAAPAPVRLEMRPRPQRVDVYALLDRSGSMSTEVASVKSNFAQSIQSITCPPLGTGNPANCVPDVWAGAGTIGYSGAGGDAYAHAVDLQPSPLLASVVTTEPGGCCEETTNFALWSTMTGEGTSTSGCSFSNAVTPRASCAGSPAANGGYAAWGYPCFREGALPLVVVFTDEAPLSGTDTNACPAWSVGRQAFLARKARLIGIVGSGAPSSVANDLRTMAQDTGTVDVTNGNTPLVFSGEGSNAGVILSHALLTAANSVPFSVSAHPSDDPTDAVDAVAAFVERLQTAQLGTSACTNGLTESDSNGDSFPDQYPGLLPGTPVCWSLVAKTNTTVPATDTAQVFKVSVAAVADGLSELDARDVYFVVPPAALP